MFYGPYTLQGYKKSSSGSAKNGAKYHKSHKKRNKMKKKK